MRPGSYTAIVYISYPPEEKKMCTVRVLIQDREARGKSTGWSFLQQGKVEKKGYGLYSYILFGSRPTAENREQHERYMKIIEAYIQVIESITALEKAGIAPHQLNVTYLLLTTKNNKDRPTAKWLLDHYDYAHARAILSALPEKNGTDGPYIVSSLRPLSSVSQISMNNILYQDLSNVPPHIIELYAKEFFNQAAQERFWEEKSLSQLILKLRRTLGILGKGAPEVYKAMAKGKLVINLGKKDN